MGNKRLVNIEEMPREKAIRNGIETLSNSELLALVLKTGTKKMNVFELSNYILNKYNNFNDLINCNYKDLIEINGIKKAKAIELLAIMEIAKRVQISKINSIKIINNADDIYNNFSLLLKEEKQEVFMVIFLNIKSHIIKYEKLFVGGISNSVVDVNLILKKALIYGASKIICLHNHPSGDPTPSVQDILITKKIIKMCEVVDIKMLDHIIIGKEGYISLKKMSYI